MQDDRLHTRYAHSEGHSSLCYTDDGKTVLTCGEDGDVRIWSGVRDEDPSSFTVGAAALAIAFKNNRFYVGTDNNVVQAYTFPECSLDGRPLRFSAPVTDIDISSDGSMLVASSCDMEIQVLEMETKKITRLSGHSAPVLGISLDPKLKFVASSGGDSTIKVWDITSASAVKTFNKVLPSTNDFFTATTFNRPAWQSVTGLHLAVIQEKKVNMYSRDDWSLKSELACPSIQKDITVISFSRCGSYVSAATSIGEVIVWKFDDGSVMSYTEHPKRVQISTMSWHPTEKEFAFCDRLGILCGLNIEGCSVNKPKEIEGTPDDITDPGCIGDDDEDNENDISIEKIKESSGWVSPSKLTGDGENDYADDCESEDGHSVSRGISTSHMQSSFQPSSTPPHFQHRYMVWNSIGIVRCFNSDEDNSIDVEFHDTMFHHSLHMSNRDGYTMASLSNKLLALACDSSGDAPSKLTCVVLNAWDGTKEWSITMDKSESIVAVAAAGNWVACATDANLLRMYTHTGIQRHVLSLPGPIVCLSGHEQVLFAVCHIGIGLPECQNLGYMLLSVSALSVRALAPCQPAPLSPKSTLKWAGFTDEGSPSLYDSDGILRTSRDASSWMAACDTRSQRKSPSDHYFVIGVSERLQSIRCVLCKGGYYPATSPRPTVVEIPLRMPLCEFESEKTVHEDVFWRHLHGLSVLKDASIRVGDDCAADVNNFEKILKQTVIRLFASACRADADMRAVDVAMLMSEQPLQMAVKYAVKVGKTYLSEKLNSIEPKDWLRPSELPVGEDSVVVVGGGGGGGGASSRRDQGNEMKNKFSTRFAQGDMFEESQPIRSTASCLPRRGEAERSEEPNEDVDNACSGDSTPVNTSLLNPFKVGSKDKGPKGLNFFNNVQPSNNAKTSKNDSLGVDKIARGKAAAEPGKRGRVSGSGPKKHKFVEWYKGQKASLELRFPDMTPNELTRAAMKIFREETSETRQRNGEAAEDSRNKESPETKRRKTEDDRKEKASAKLSAFTFVK